MRNDSTHRQYDRVLKEAMERRGVGWSSQAEKRPQLEYKQCSEHHGLRVSVDLLFATVPDLDPCAQLDLFRLASYMISCL